MYEKAMGMAAADLCDNVLKHARRYFASTVHVVSVADGDSGGGDVRGGAAEVGSNMMVMDDPELASAAREARALYGMLTTIHEVWWCTLYIQNARCGSASFYVCLLCFYLSLVVDPSEFCRLRIALRDGPANKPL